MKLKKTATFGARLIVRAAGFAALPALTGCSFFAPKTQWIPIRSEPAGAQVFIDERLVGETPLSAAVPRRRPARVVVRKDGYQDFERVTSTRLGPPGLADAVGGVVLMVPLLGLLSDGAYEQEPAKMDAELIKVETFESSEPKTEPKAEPLPPPAP